MWCPITLHSLQLAELAKYAKHDAELTFQLAERLLPQITRPKVELPILMDTVRLFTERAIRVDVAGIDQLDRQVREDDRAVPGGG